MSNSVWTQYIKLSVNGKALDSYRMSMIQSIEFEDSAISSSLLTITIDDPDLFILEDDIFVEEVPVWCLGGWKHDTKFEFEGFIAAIDIDFPEDGTPQLTIVCMDRTHLMNRKEKKRTWQKKKRSDVVKLICADYGLKCEVDATEKVIDTISQSDKTDIQFIMDMAQEEDFVVLVDKNKLSFKKKDLVKKAVATLEYREGGCDLMSFTPKITKANKREDVNKADVNSQTGKAESGTANEKTSRDINGESVKTTSKYKYTGAGKWEKV